jgi:hypothetical protein
MLWIFFAFLIVLFFVFMRPKARRHAIDTRVIHFADIRRERIYDKGTGSILGDKIVEETWPTR